MFLINPYIYSTTAWENLKSISFDGVDEYVDIGRVTETESATNLSFSCWIKSLDLSSDKVIFGKFNSASNNLYGVVSADGSLYFVLSNGVNYGVVYTAASEVVTNTWYHIAMVYDGSLTGNTNRAKVYINGVNKTDSTASSINSTTSSSTTSLHLGVRGGDLAGYYDGNIDEVSIFDYSLSQSEVTAIWNSGCPDNLMSLAEAKRPEHYYRFDDVTYPTVDDIGQTGGNDGTMTNQESSDLVTNSPCGFNNYSLAFDGVDEIVNIGDIAILDGVTNYSVSLWFKTPSLATLQIIMGKKLTDNSQNWSIYINTLGAIYNAMQASNAKTASSTIAINTWYHFVATYNGGAAAANRIQLYVDGVSSLSSVTGTIPTSTTNAANDHYLGARNISNTSIDLPFTGQIDEVGIFDYTLSQSEVTDIYNSGVPNDLMELASAKQPEHYYRMGDNDTYPTISDVGATSGNDGTMVNGESSDINGDVPLENN